jgi:hypothetical protein
VTRSIRKLGRAHQSRSAMRHVGQPESWMLSPISSGVVSRLIPVCTRSSSMITYDHGVGTCSHGLADMFGAGLAANGEIT